MDSRCQTATGQTRESRHVEVGVIDLSSQATTLCYCVASTLGDGLCVRGLQPVSCFRHYQLAGFRTNTGYIDGDKSWRPVNRVGCGVTAC